VDVIPPDRSFQTETFYRHPATIVLSEILFEGRAPPGPKRRLFFFRWVFFPSNFSGRARKDSFSGVFRRASHDFFRKEKRLLQSSDIEDSTPPYSGIFGRKSLLPFGYVVPLPGISLLERLIAQGFTPSNPFFVFFEDSLNPLLKESLMTYDS